MFSLILFIQLIGHMMTVATCIFHMDLAFRARRMNFVTMLIGGEIFATVLFVYCYYGSIATNRLTAYSKTIYNCKWYLLPSDMQKSFIVMIACAQHPQFYTGFGMINLNLETFSTVCASMNH